MSRPACPGRVGAFYFGAGDHDGRSLRPVSTTTRNLPDQGVGWRVLDRTQNVWLAAIALS